MIVKRNDQLTRWFFIFFFFLWFFLFLEFFVVPSPLLSQDKTLSFEECEKIVAKIATAQENLRKFIRERNFKVDLVNATVEERNYFYQNLKNLIVEEKNFRQMCIVHYGVRVDELEKLPKNKVVIFYDSTYYKGVFSKDVYPKLPPFFFDYRYFDKLDLRYLIIPTRNFEDYYKKLSQFKKKYLSGYEVKELFCYIEHVFDFTNKIYKVSCPKFYVEKEFSVPDIPIKINLPPEHIRVETKEGQSIVSLIFSGKYKYTYQTREVDLGEGHTISEDDVSYILNKLFTSSNEVNEWLKRELTIRGLHGRDPS